jgi:murein DD-endopeptidase MepM/ murein hydrolase activator NlpD
MSKIRLALAVSLAFGAGCKTPVDQLSNTNVSPSNQLEYEVTKDTEIETLYFPFKKCLLNSGTTITLGQPMVNMGIMAKVIIADIKINGDVSTSPETDTGTSYSEDAVGDKELVSDNGLINILDSFNETENNSTYGLRPGFALTSTSRCNGSEAFLVGEELRISSDSIIAVTAKPTVVPPKSLPGVSPSVPSSGFEFPLLSRPTNDWFYGAARFGAGRAGGRVHAASDLYTQVGRPVVAIASGIVLDYYYFYSGTYALVVEHDDGRVVRYGEIASNRVSIGDRVSKGQTIATVGRMNCCNPMLHFEMYDGSQVGGLTNPGANKYNRRGDITNPENFLDKIRR